MRWIQFLLGLLVCVSCIGERTANGPLPDIEVQLLNLPLDSCAFRINHIITGKEVFYQKRVDLSKPIVVPDLPDDMYIAVFSWPRTLISHQVIRSKQFDKDEGIEEFQFTKPLYVNRTHSGTRYKMTISNPISLEELETNGTDVLQFKNEDCEECDLADRYWSLFGLFFDRKNDRIDSAKQSYYTYIGANDLQNANKAFLKMEELKVHYRKDDALDAQIQELVIANPQSQVSAFFLFYQLYNHREFNKFKTTFDLLKGAAMDSKYYKMMAKQY